METTILALMSDMYDPSGIWCLASILWIIIIALCYSRGVAVGQGACAFIFIVGALCVSDGESYIGNNSQTKWIKQPPSDYLDLHAKYMGHIEDYCFITRFTDHHNSELHFYYLDEMEREKLRTEREKNGSPKMYTVVKLLPAHIISPFWRYVPNNHNYIKGKGACLDIKRTIFSLDDYYDYNVEYSPINIPDDFKDGEMGIPPSIYHPGSIWLFAIFGFIPLIIGTAVGVRS